MKPAHLKTWLLILVLTWVATGLLSTLEANEPDGFELPEAERFDQTAGEPIVDGVDAPTFVAAADFTNDGKPDFVAVEGSGTVIPYTNTVGTDEEIHGKFRRDGGEIKLEGQLTYLLAEDFDSSNGLDLAISRTDFGEDALPQEIGQITGLTADTLTDDNAAWPQDSLKGLELNPNVAQDETFEVLGNTGPSTVNESPLDLPPHTLALKGEHADLTTIASVGDYYSIQRGTRKDKDGPMVEIFLNDGNGGFAKASCAQTIPLPKERIIDKLEAGDFNGDGNLDIAVLHSEYLEGRSTKYTFKILDSGDINFGDLEDILKELFLGGKRGYELGTAFITVEDTQANFPNLTENFGNPNINQDEYYLITSNTPTSWSAAVELPSSMSEDLALTWLGSLAQAGDPYRVKIGDSEIMVLQGYGDGCFEIASGISGEDYDLFFGETTVNTAPPGSPPNLSTAVRSVLRNPNQNFLPENSLIGRSVNPNIDEEGSSASFTIEANDSTSLYFQPGNGDITEVARDLVDDGDPNMFMIEPMGGGISYSAGAVIPNGANFWKIPGEYLLLAQNLGDNGPPYNGAFADFDGDGDIDFIYAALNLFFKENGKDEE